MDDDGIASSMPIPIRVKIIVEGEQMTIDLSEVSPQVAYSRIASVHNWLRDFLSRCVSRSAAAKTSSGIDMAIFIPKVQRASMPRLHRFRLQRATNRQNALNG